MVPIIAVVLLGAGAALFSRLNKNEDAEREATAQVKAWKLTFSEVTAELQSEITSLLSQLGQVSSVEVLSTLRTTPVSSVVSLVWRPELRQASRWNYPAQRWPGNLVRQDPVA